MAGDRFAAAQDDVAGSSGVPTTAQGIALPVRKAPERSDIRSSRIGFSPTALAFAAATSVLVGLGMYIILAILGEGVLGSLALPPAMLVALILAAMSAQRGARRTVVGKLSQAIMGHTGVTHVDLLEIEARKWAGGWIGRPRVINVRFPNDVDDNAHEWAPDFADVVSASMGYSYEVVRHNRYFNRITLRRADTGGNIRAEDVPVRTTNANTAPLPERIERPGRRYGVTGEWLIPLGVDASGTAVAWDLRAARSHLLVIGPNGTGKRTLITGLVLEVASRGWPVWVVDHRRVDLVGLRGWPNVQLVATTFDDQIVTVNQAWREMESRIAMVESGTDRSELEPLVVVMHHFRGFAKSMAEWSLRTGRGTPVGGSVPERVADLLRHGHGVNIILVLSTLHADDPLLESDHRDELGAVVYLGATAAELASARNGRALPAAAKTPGRAMVRLGRAEAVEVQCYWTPDPSEVRRGGDDRDVALVERLRPTAAAHPPLATQLPPNSETGDGDEAGRNWNTVMEAELVEGSAEGTAALADWSRASSATGRAEPPPVPASVASNGWSEVVMVSQLESGNLARLDDEHGWVIVEGLEQMDDPTKVRVRWRGTDGAGAIDFSRTRTVRIRHMNDGVY